MLKEYSVLFILLFLSFFFFFLQHFILNKCFKVRKIIRCLLHLDIDSRRYFRKVLTNAILHLLLHLQIDVFVAYFRSLAQTWICYHNFKRLCGFAGFLKSLKRLVLFLWDFFIACTWVSSMETPVAFIGEISVFSRLI
jgi:hypothetical protein